MSWMGQAEWGIKFTAKKSESIRREVTKIWVNSALSTSGHPIFFFLHECKYNYCAILCLSKFKLSDLAEEASAPGPITGFARPLSSKLLPLDLPTTLQNVTNSVTDLAMEPSPPKLLNFIHLFLLLYFNKFELSDLVKKILLPRPPSFAPTLNPRSFALFDLLLLHRDQTPNFLLLHTSVKTSGSAN